MFILLKSIVIDDHVKGIDISKSKDEGEIDVLIDNDGDAAHQQSLHDLREG